MDVEIVSMFPTFPQPTCLHAGTISSMEEHERAYLGSGPPSESPVPAPDFEQVKSRNEPNSLIVTSI